jgi:protein O-mannosyl-transferase
MEQTKPFMLAARWCRRRPTAAYLTISILWILLIYTRVIFAGFAPYDDVAQIVHNPSLSTLGTSLKYFHTSVSFISDLRGSGESFFRPLYWLSLALDKQLWGSNPAGFHLTNVFLHWSSGLFSFLLLRRLGVTALSAALTCLLWLCLPINAEAVVWIAARAYCLATFFLLVGLLIADHYLFRPTLFFLVLYCLSSVCAVLSHEEGVLILVFTALLAVVRHKVKSREAIALYAASLVTILLYFCVRHWMGAIVSTDKGAISSFALFFWKYVRWMIFPLHMSIERSSDTPHPTWSVHALAAWFWLALACAAAIKVSRGVPKARIGLAYMFTALLPYCGITFLYQGMAERFTYVASLGLALIVVLLCMEAKVRLRPFAIGAVALWVLWGVYRLETRIGEWSDAVRLYQSSVQATPLSKKLHYNLGAFFEERKDFVQAGSEYQKTLDLEPQHEPAIAGLGNVNLNLGRFEDAEKMFQKALQIKPDDVKAVNNYGTALRSLGKIDAAKMQYDRAIALAPNNDNAYCNLGVLLFQTGNVNEAILQFSKATQINPTDPVPLFNLAAIYQKADRLDLAINLYRRVLQLNPGDADASSALESLLMNQSSVLSH